MIGNLNAEAEINAGLITNIISINPDLWEIQNLRIKQYFDRRPSEKAPEIRHVLNIKK